MPHHQITILNLKNLDVVSYPIIKLIGCVQFPVSETCHIGKETKVYLSQNDTVVIAATDLCQNKFKFLVELKNGRNQIQIKFCCETTSIFLEHIPSISKYSVIPLYVICEDHDGCFQSPPTETSTAESACKRITLCSKLLQCVTAEKLLENQLGRKTFSLGSDCQVFRSHIKCQDARSLSQRELWENVGREIMNSHLGSDYHKYLAFLSCTRYCGEKYKESDMTTHEELLQITEGYVALGGGGLALFGTACLYTWPETFEDIIRRFEDTTPVDKTQFLDDSCYRGTLGACFSTTLGSVLHELFHTFNLGHTADGIMGRGFDNIYKVFTQFSSPLQDVESSMDAQKNFQDKIEFKEEFEPDSLLERLRCENKKKEFTVIKKFEEVDDTVLSKSCAMILHYHRWFQETPSRQSSILTFDTSNKLIKSTSGVKVVEIREIYKELILKSWIFEGKILKFSFKIPDEVFSELHNGKYLIFAEDTSGCILRQEFTV